jgi:primosomal protein N' (replication factor Y)
MMFYADVALPVNVDREFTYIVPPELDSSALVGVRAVVPFGRKYATGLIVARPASTSIRGLKPVREILDPAPVMSAELLRLCRWIAAYYFSPLGDVLKAAMPQGFSPSSKRVVRLGSMVSEEALGAAAAVSPQRAAIIGLLRPGGGMFTTDLKRRSGVKDINGILNDLVKDGILESDEYIPRPAGRPKYAEFVVLKDQSRERLRKILDTLPARRAKARRLLEYLLAMKSEAMSVRDLLSSSGASSGVFRGLVTSGAVTTLKREVTRQQEFGTEEQTLGIVLNKDQRTVLDAVVSLMTSGSGGTFLLHGVTGSGKTQVYIEAIRACRALGKAAIVLVPEISLTPQMVRRFKSHFADDVIVVHSRMAAGERHDAWRRAKTGKSRIVIGPRSAIFAPLENIGLIVVDEEHEGSYKQYDASPRYHARDVAVVRGGHTGAVVLLGSATPSAETYQNAVSGKYVLLSMPMRVDNVPLPVITIVDMTTERRRDYARLKESMPSGARGKLKEFVASPVSALLREKITDRLERKEGVILLQNRRGFAPFVECADCGYVEMCDNCNVTLTYHLTRKHLRCHYCGLTRTPAILCPNCGGTNIALRGIGTQKVEQELIRLFPSARVARMDLDTTSRRGSHDRILRRFGDGTADILLGTQMVAKGLDFPRVTLVGVISADTQMLLPDFRSSERTFQLLTQVAGRAGRSVLRGEVVIQTNQPGHPALAHVIDHDFRAFMEEELRARKELDYPPYSRIALIETRGVKEEDVRRAAENFAAALKRAGGPPGILGPAPAVIGKINRNYRWHVLVKSLKTDDPAGSVLRHAVQSARATAAPQLKGNVRLIIDMDPVGVL